ncbi:MAG: electron transfer flavoprotein subunit alpha/FixB family protein, partial [Chitinophagaceae bacterium]|nr:electron transfer flavoprotein subunit alpha/FixB family protein [Chitinophagaceae bacterium]
MSVLVFIDQSEGHLKKSSLEAMSYGAALAAQSGTEAEGVVLGPTQEDLSSLGKYGIKKIHHVNNPSLSGFDAQAYTRAIAQVAEKTGANMIVFSNNVDCKAIAPRLSVRMKAGLVSGATGLPESGGDFIVKKTVFSGKGYARIAVKTPVKIIALNPNAFTVTEAGGTAEV